MARFAADQRGPAGLRPGDGGLGGDHGGLRAVIAYLLSPLLNRSPDSLRER
jgi:hypothetical protein